jgi:arylsulfatase A-like enzyme
MALDLDIAPTILDMAGVRIPASMQGRSLKPLFQGNETAWRRDWFYEYYENPGVFNVPKNRGIRTDRYKLIEYYEEDPIEFELYDLDKDPGENQNLYGEPQYADVTRQLLRRLEELRQETGEM